MSNGMSNEFWVGFDLGGTKMMALVMDAKMKIIGRERKKTRVTNENGVIMERIVKTIRTAIENTSLANITLAGIGIGVPGVLELSKGAIMEAPNLGCKKVDIKGLLEKEFSCPVVISNDADAGIYGEYSFGAAKNAFSALGIFCGTGIGGGLVHKGALFTGSRSTCFEVGHLPVIPDGNLCGCGRYGCLETVASRLAIASAAAVAVYRGEAPLLQQIAGTDISAIRSGTLAEAIKGGDAVIERIVTHAAGHLGRVVGGLVNTLMPDIVVLGGGLVEAMPDIFLAQVKNGIKNHTMPSFENLVSVVAARLGDDAAAIGAATWAKTVIRGA